jgi:predicted GIY-YIG superfamily endonuclease
MLLLNTGKHYYIGSTGCLDKRLKCHEHGRFNQGARATRAYGFHNIAANVLWIKEYETREAAYDAEQRIASQLRLEQPDVPICGDDYSYGTFNSDQYE